LIAGRLPGSGPNENLERAMPNGKPNILIIWGDDVGISNLSCYSDGLMGYRTANIDRIAKEASDLLTTTASRVVRRVGQRSSVDKIRSAPA
jgi:hypothetical protein